MCHRYYARPAIAFFIVLALGQTLGYFLQGRWFGAMAVVLICCLGWMVYGAFTSKSQFIAPLVSMFLVGYLSISPWLKPDFATNHIRHHAGQAGKKILVGIVENFQAIAYPKARARLVVNVDTIVGKSAAIVVTGKIRLTVDGHMPTIYPGTRIRFSTRLKRPRNFNNPGGFDYERHMAFRQIWVTGYCRSEDLQALVPSPSSSLNSRVFRLRHEIVELVDKRLFKPGSHQARSTLKALSVGDRSGITPDLREKFNRAGVAHLLAISGLHIGIVAGVAFWGLRWLLSFVPALLHRAWVSKWAAAGAIGMVFAYGAVSGWSASTQRAVFMVTVYLLAYMVMREQDTLNTLCWAGLIILLLHPPSLFAVSFQLSFAAVFTILYGYPRIMRSPAIQFSSGIRRWTLYKLSGMLAVSLLAVLGTIPLTMYYFNQASAVGLLANLVLIPLVGFCTVPVAVLGVFVYPFSQTLSVLCMQVGLGTLSPALYVIDALARPQWTLIRTITPSMIEMWGYYLLLASLLTLLKPVGGSAGAQSLEAVSGESPERQHPRRLNLVCVALASLILVADVAYWLRERFFRTDFTATMIDVGQGSAALLELPKGGVFVIDGGGFSDRSIFDVGARVVAPVLWRRKIKTIDTIVLSHPNSDHLNGLLFLLENFTVGRVWTNGQVVATKGFTDFSRILQQRGIHVPEFSAIPRRSMVNGVCVEILYPPADFKEHLHRPFRQDTNNNSIVVKLTYRQWAILFTGDITRKAERELVVRSGDRLNSHVLVVPHHGSRTSSSSLLVKRVNPQFALISARRSARAQHPHSEVLSRYSKHGCRIFRTDLHGAIQVTINERGLHVVPTVTTDPADEHTHSEAWFWTDQNDIKRVLTKSVEAPKGRS
jgi:competence protein ComEC